MSDVKKCVDNCKIYAKIIFRIIVKNNILPLMIPNTKKAIRLLKRKTKLFMNRMYCYTRLQYDNYENNENDDNYNNHQYPILYHH